VPIVRVVTYNVRSLRDDQAALFAVVRDCRPDVVLVQEAPRHLRWRARCAALARECGLLYVAGGRTAGGNLLLSGHRVSVHGTVERRIPQRPRDPIRGIVAATLGVGRWRFGAVGVHLGLAAAARAREVDEVLGVVRDLGDLPVVVGGDLNETPDGPSWAALLAAGFYDPGEVAATPTFPARAPSTRIDALLVPRTGVAVKEHRVPDGPGPADQLARASDHLPLLAELDFA
jgi:endonuclease/exonuclease/phosphatase family metal-dependent hydrolase